MEPELSREELLRYSRHVILPEVGGVGQRRLKAAKVLLIGAGGLGSPTALYLAASGVGRIGIVDFDEVDLTNLHRQVIHGTADVGRSKLDSAEDSIREVNPNVQVVKHAAILTSENALEILNEYNIVVDGTDNFPTRYLVNDACVLLHKLNMYGSIFSFEGQATVFCAPGGPCYRCLYPEPPPPGTVPSCAEGGVLGVLPGVIGLIQATETVKAILGIGDPLIGRLLLYDALAMSFRELRIRRDPACPICGDHPTITALVDYEELCGLPKRRDERSAELVGRGSAGGSPPLPLGGGFQTRGSASGLPEIEASELAAMVERREPFTLLDVREPHEFAAGNIPGAILMPLGQVAGRLRELDRGQTIVVQCQSGARSAKACDILRAQGFVNVLNLRGGMLAWLKLGL